MKKKILLIQSAQTHGNSTKQHLEERGYKVVVANSGLTALMLARNMSIDLILIDLALADIEGMDMCRRFRQRQDTNAIPIILLTARGYQPAKNAHGPDDYLAKPYAERDLDQKITAVLASKQTTLHALGRQGHPGETSPALITMNQQAPQQEPEDVPEEAVTPPLAAPTLPPGPREAADAVAPRKTATAPAAAAAGNKRSDDAGRDGEQPLLPFSATGAAVVDPATGLFGKPQFEAMFDKEFKRALRFKHPMSLMLINVDGRSRGQVADEPLVRAMIALVQKTIREVDTAAWWSGESFMVLLPNTSPTDALQAAARTLEAVAMHPFSWPDATRVTMNIGVAGLPDPIITTPLQLIESASAITRRAQELMTPPPFDVPRH